MGFLIVILISVALIGGAAYFGQQRANRLISEGKMVKRNGDFYKFAEIFVVSGIDYDNMLAAVNSTDFSELKAKVYPNNGGKSEIFFKSTYEWNAALSYRGEEGGKYKYRFEFIAWNERRGIPVRLDTMNMMETKIEKMILKLDEHTTVTTEEMKLSSKRKAF